MKPIFEEQNKAHRKVVYGWGVRLRALFRILPKSKKQSAKWRKLVGLYVSENATPYCDYCGNAYKDYNYFGLEEPSTEICEECRKKKYPDTRIREMIY